MIVDPKCPICFGSDWLSIRSYSYQREPSLPRNPPWSKQDLRKVTLFDVWFHGKDLVTLTTQCCKVCGFVCFNPRPDAGDILRKYEFLSQHEPMGILHKKTDRGLRNEQIRSERLVSLTAAFRDLQDARILDVGGGDGRLLKSFLNHSSKCFVVDFNDQPIEGVIRLGKSIEDIETSEFDVIVCSHVIEHVADPRQMLLQLKSLLVRGGLLYVEVPFELWFDAPIGYDPVTHINFFTKQSLATVLLSAGFAATKIRYKALPYGKVYKRAIWALAMPSEASRKPELDAREALNLIHPGTTKKLWRRMETIYIQKFLNSSNRRKAPSKSKS